MTINKRNEIPDDIFEADYTNVQIQAFSGDDEEYAREHEADLLIQSFTDQDDEEYSKEYAAKHFDEDNEEDAA